MNISILYPFHSDTKKNTNKHVFYVFFAESYVFYYTFIASNYTLYYNYTLDEYFSVFLEYFPFFQ